MALPNRFYALSMALIPWIEENRPCSHTAPFSLNLSLAVRPCLPLCSSTEQDLWINWNVQSTACQDRISGTIMKGKHTYSFLKTH
jgi:hypothetical protein